MLQALESDLAISSNVEDAHPYNLAIPLLCKPLVPQRVVLGPAASTPLQVEYKYRISGPISNLLNQILHFQQDSPDFMYMNTGVSKSGLTVV